jgi:hypothetical protein
MNFYAVEKPTAGQRLARALGFGMPAVPDDRDEPQFAPGRIITQTHACFDWKDRLRVLVSGHVVVIVSTKTNVPVATAVSTSGIGVLAPGSR